MPTGETYASILVPLDGTPFAEAALRPAVELAKRTGSTIHLATAVQDAASKALMMESMPTTRLDPERRAAPIEDYLEDVKRRIDDEGDFDVRLVVLSDANTAHALAGAATQLDSDLVVAATHSPGSLAATFLGSTATDLMHAAGCPTLLIPSTELGPDTTATPMQGRVRGVMAAIDPVLGEADPALAHARTWARIHNASITLVQVILTVPVPGLGKEGSGSTSFAAGLSIGLADRKAMEERLEAVAEGLRASGLEAKAEELQGPSVAAAILASEPLHDTDLVTVGRREKSVLSRLLLGNESDRLHASLTATGLLVCPIEGAD